MMKGTFSIEPRLGKMFVAPLITEVRAVFKYYITFMTRD